MGTHVREQEKCVSRRPFLKGVAAGLIGIPFGISVSAEPDPVFAAIAAHSQLWRAVEQVCYQDGLSDQVKKASLREGEALHRFLATVPTTRTGLLAYIDHLGSPMGFGEDGPSDEEMPAILKTIRAFAEARHA